jgi:predicted alpha/beta-hydrolase family hydrolase
MMRTIRVLLVLCLLLLAFYTYGGTPIDSVYIDGADNKNGVILAHGKGKHPKWLVVEPLRQGINSQLGYHSLSLQMPTGFSHWKDYAKSFPKAYKTIKDAITFLKNDKDVSRVFLIGHSMGGRMASAFVSENSNVELAGLVVAGCRNNGGRPLSCNENLQGAKLPVLDIWGGNDDKDSRSAAERKRMVSDTYTQVEISGANHTFEGNEDELVAAVVSWLKRQK